MPENKEFIPDQSASEDRDHGPETKEEQKVRAGLRERVNDNLRYLDNRTLKKLLIFLTGATLSYSGLNENAWAQSAEKRSVSAEGQVGEQERQHGQITRAEAEALIGAVTDDSDSSYYDRKDTLKVNYNKFPDDLELRVQAWPKMHPELGEYALSLAKVSDYNKAFRFFIRELEPFVWSSSEIPVHLQDSGGGLDKEKLKQVLEQAVEAIDFVDTPGESQAIWELVKGKVVNLFSDPTKIKEQGWDKFAGKVGSEHQARIMGEIIFTADINGKPVVSPAELESWLPLTSWVDSDQKAGLVVAVQGVNSPERLLAWKEFIEKVCKPAPLVKAGESGADIKMGVNPELFGEMRMYLMRMTAGGDINEQLSRAEAKYNDLISRNK